jgi:hypothetical protein
MSALITLVLLVVALRSRPDTVVRNLLVCGLFGATAALSVPGLGGAPVKPALFMLPFVLWWAVWERGMGGLLRQVAPSTPGFLLILFLGWGLLTAAVSPIYFEGQTWVFSTNRSSEADLRVHKVPLDFSSTNLTQSIYAICGVVTFIAVRALLAGPLRLQRFGTALLLVSACNVAALVINLAEAYAGIPSVLALIKTANYAIAAGGTLQGLGRISGTFSETSAWSTFTLPLVAATFSLWRQGFKPRLAGPLCLAMVAGMLLSTSSTAYVGLAALASCIGAVLFWKNLVGSPRRRLGPLTVLALGAVVAVCIVGLVKPQFFTAVYEFFQVTVWRKLESSSGQERSSWNSQALINLADTFGIGAGLGSARASSYPLVLLSNVGVIGFSLFAAFLLRIFLSPVREADPEAVKVVWAARWPRPMH